MKKTLYPALFSLLVLLFCPNHAFCQKDSTSNDNYIDSVKTKKFMPFKFGVDYLNDNVFMGRAEVAKTPIIEPELKYAFKSGLYFSGAAEVLPNNAKDKKLDGGNLTAGYDFDITDDLGGGVSFSKLFYSKTSVQIASSVSASFNADLDYDIADIITPTIGLDYDINRQGGKNDFFLSPGLSHDFAGNGLFAKHDLFIISPTVSLNAGTQNFYDAYLTRKNATVAALLAKLTKRQKANLSNFQLLDYELSAPVEYKYSHFIFSFIPTYAIPQNTLPPIVTTNLSKETATFYFEVGVAVKF